ncbi:LOW QUALITY PROTEIN: Hypothetical protein PHPALM_37832 [Phytophthora palmivora]|uniref:Ubiquitin-like protease family profile domain-containing protein n=1 Tax=Phytophthora palmivora TaxID=4796 RepID=A0A2P4WWF0_9STRA|nr:LOW QUALITY PROTEIN: Hypothetical protein PHPALM_37832 [Phytophthora palmivora]
MLLISGSHLRILVMLPSEHIGYVETLNLSVNRVSGVVVGGHQLLDFRSNLWLHTTSILVSLMALRDEYVDVGIISPPFHDFVILEQQRRTAGGFGAGNPKYKRVRCCFNVDRHWVTFMIGTITRELPASYLTISKASATTKLSKRAVIEPLLQFEGMLSCEKVERCKQHDGSSCGVWCIAILELILIDSTLDDCLYKLMPYLRMRFLYKAIVFVGKESAYER